jgi:hypothetical protein
MSDERDIQDQLKITDADAEVSPADRTEAGVNTGSESTQEDNVGVLGDVAHPFDQTNGIVDQFDERTVQGTDTVTSPGGTSTDSDFATGADGTTDATGDTSTDSDFATGADGTTDATGGTSTNSDFATGADGTTDVTGATDGTTGRHAAPLADDGLTTDDGGALTGDDTVR